MSEEVPPTPWEVVNPPGFPAHGYSNAIRAGGRLCIAGQTDMDSTGEIRSPGDLAAQARGAFQNLAEVLRAAGAQPGHLVCLRIYVVDAAAYRAEGRRIKEAWREAFGRWYPAMTLVEVSRLYDPRALIEVEGEAVLPA